MADNQPPELPVEQAPEDVQLTPDSPVQAAPSEVPQEIPLEAEVAQEDALPPETPPVYMKKPPVLLAAVSFAVILLFIIGLAIIFSGRKNNDKAVGAVPTSVPAASSSSTGYRTASPSSAPNTPTPPASKWTAYTSASGSFSIDVPANMTVKYSSGGATLSFCDIGPEETGIHVFDEPQAKESKLDVSFAARPAAKDTPDAWVLRHCPEVLGSDTEKGIIDEDGVKGVYFVRRFNPDTPDKEPYNLAVLLKGGRLSFVYARARTDLAMTELFDPMFLSFKLLAK